MKLEDVEIGRMVVYTPFKGCNSDLIEPGIVTGKNDRYVFVKYQGDLNSKATDAGNIEYMSHK